MWVHHLLTNYLFIDNVNEKIIGQIVGFSEVCDQNGDRVSKNEISCRFNSVNLEYIKPAH